MMPNEGNGEIKNGRAAKLSVPDDQHTSSGLLHDGTCLGPLQLLSGVSTSPTPFESIQQLAARLAAKYQARLMFISFRRVVPLGSAQFPYDTVGGTLATMRSRLYAQKQPLDLLIAGGSSPQWWDPNASNGTALGAVSSIECSNLQSAGLLAIPAIGMSCVMLCVVDVARLSSEDRSRSWPEITWICTNYGLEHLRRFPLRSKAASTVLSPQEEKVIQHCREGLTDKEIGKVLGISPHTVRTHLNNAKQKLDARNKTHAVHLYERSLLLQAD